MKNILKAALVVSFLVPAVSFAGDAPKKDTTAAKDTKTTAPKTDAKTPAKVDSKAKDTKVAPKTDAKTETKKPATK